MKIFVTDLKPGMTFDSIFLVDEIAVRQTKNNTDYWILTLRDKTGTQEGKVWDATAWGEEAGPVKRGDYIKIRATAGSYRGKTDVNISRVRGLDPLRDADFTYEDFIPADPDRFRKFKQLENDAAAIKNPGLRAVVGHIFKDPFYHMNFRDAPAAASIHQPFIGGLVDHVGRMLGVAERVCQMYLDEEGRDLIYAACFLHDIGKIQELNWSTGIGYSDEGQLIGHVGIGLEILERLRPIYWSAVEADRVDDPQPDFDKHRKLWLHLRHLVASHHGQLEWRAIAKPMSREANLFHLIDMIDSRMGMFDQIEKETPDAEGFYGWNGRLEGKAWT